MLMNETRKPSVKKPLHNESMSMPTIEEDEEELLLLEKKRRKNSPLTLEEAPTIRTRGALYTELSKDERVKTEEDYYEFPSPVSRLISLLIDTLFAFVLIRLSFFTAPLLVKVFNIFLNRYKLVMWFSQEVLLKMATISVTAAIFFLMIVIPAAFYNTSLGKKITGLRVRGDKKYTISLTQAFKREIIFKPLSMASLVGFVLPFFDKKKKSLHDRFAGTFVIKD